MITKHEWRQIEDALLLSAHQLKTKGVELTEDTFMIFSQAFTLKFFGQKNFDGEAFTNRLKTRFEKLNA